MEPLRKIPLDMLLQILQELYDGGADYVDISGETDVEGESRDTIKFTIQPEYLSELDEEEIEDIIMERDIPLSDEDINDLI